jgi:hypothetical protein
MDSDANATVIHAQLLMLCWQQCTTMYYTLCVILNNVLHTVRYTVRYRKLQDGYSLY